MSYLIALIFSGAVIYVVIRFVISLAKEAGKESAENDRLKKDIELDKKRADAMMKDQTIAQTIRDLINGKF